MCVICVPFGNVRICGLDFILQHHLKTNSSKDQLLWCFKIHDANVVCYCNMIGSDTQLFTPKSYIIPLTESIINDM